MPQGYETITVEDADDIKDITGENGMISAHRTLCKLHFNRFSLCDSTTTFLIQLRSFSDRIFKDFIVPGGSQINLPPRVMGAELQPFLWCVA
jgi:hypothetical protein